MYVLNYILIYREVLLISYCQSVLSVVVGVNSVSYPSPPPTVSIDNELLLEDTPEGYYPFVESPKMEPPQVKLPPYIKSTKSCPGIGRRLTPASSFRKSLNNLCGDLNKGFVPVNPMSQNVYGSPYPFELIKNKTLQYFSKTLPMLKLDDTIPRIASIQSEPQYYLYQKQLSFILTNNSGNHPIIVNKSKNGFFLHDTTCEPFKIGWELFQLTNHNSMRVKRSLNSTAPIKEDRKMMNTLQSLYQIVSNLTQRQSRKFCDNDKGLFCLLYKLIQGQMFRSLAAQKRQDHQPLEYRTSNEVSGWSMSDGPPTPCPAKVDYATPVFARNYQGVWKYIVQIPYEGYFTQTVEVTKCINTKCHYMDGGCLSSPRWVSLLVAEIFYPETFTPINHRPVGHRTPVISEDPPPIQDYQTYQQYLHKRAIPSSNQEQKSTSNSKKSHCDGVDEFGCFQVRLYFDWFLIPGSCKCWRPDYFSKYMRWNRESSYEL